MEDTIQVISLLEPLYKDELEDESVLYINQVTTPKSNELVKLPTKDIEQLPTPSRTVSLDLLESNTAL